MPTEPIAAPFMTPQELARLLRCTTKTLREWRQSKPIRGPAFFKTGDGQSNRVRYSREAVAAWIDSRTTPTES